MIDSDLWAWKQNVITEFKGLSVDEVKTRLLERSLDYAIVAEQTKHDFNLGSLIRNANAFGARAIYYVGLKHLDRRGCCGVQNYTTIEHLPTIADLIAIIERDNWTLVGIENDIDGAVPLDDFIYPARPMLVFGTETCGLTKEMIAACKSIVYIPQIGSVPSLNVGTASGIVMNDYVTKYRRLNGAH